MKIQIKSDGNDIEDKPSLSLRLARPVPRRKNKELNTEDKPIEEKVKSDETKLDSVLVEAVQSLAISVKGDPKQIESELLKKLRDHAVESAEAKKAAPNLENVFLGMKIDRSKVKKPEQSVSLTSSRMEESSKLTSFSKPMTATKRDQKSSVIGSRVNLFGSEPLNIFDNAKQTEIPMTTWRNCSEHELKILSTQPPANAFEEMIQWTEQGKLWPFPIDNELGLDEEAKVGFEEHVLLDHHLEDFPKNPAVQYFMELVLTGLSKNPYISSQRKRDHIQWYKDYFTEKAELLSAEASMASQ